MQNHPFRWSSFWSWRHRKPAWIHWKDAAPKTSNCLVRILVQRHNWASFLWKWARRDRYNQWRLLSDHVERIFVHKNWKGGYWQQPKLHSMFCALFLKITLSAAELMSFSHLGAAIWHRWTIICVVPSKINVTATSQW